jgi:predicted DNA-binding mobile mystery protein A
MKVDLRQLRRSQLDNALSQWRRVRLPARPVTGWIKAIRQALGMSSLALARRLAVTDSAVRKLEQAESSDAITLGTLRKMAAALDCELQYALVPRQPLNDTLQAQAALRAKEQVLAVSRSMALEDQAVDPALTAAQIEAAAQALLAKSGKGLW